MSLKLIDISNDRVYLYSSTWQIWAWHVIGISTKALIIGCKNKSNNWNLFKVVLEFCKENALCPLHVNKTPKDWVNKRTCTFKNPCKGKNLVQFSFLNMLLYKILFYLTDCNTYILDVASLHSLISRKVLLPVYSHPSGPKHLATSERQSTSHKSTYQQNVYGYMSSWRQIKKCCANLPQLGFTGNCEIRAWRFWWFMHFLLSWLIF